MAILVRAGFQTRAFEERFLSIGLPYRVIGGLRFYERQEIRDAVAYIRAVMRPDDDLAFERIVNLPKARPRRGLAAPGPRAWARGRPLSLSGGGAADRDRRAQAPRPFGVGPG